MIKAKLFKIFSLYLPPLIKKDFLMKKIALLSILFISLGAKAATPTSQDVLMQLVKNAHGGVELVKIDGQTSYRGYVGTGYQYFFYKEKAYVKPEIDVRWGEIRYKNNTDNHYVKTTSIAVPVTVGYNVFQQDLIGMNIFGGVRFEQILNSSNKNFETKINNSQIGLTGGASMRLMNKFSVNASYFYGLTSLFNDGTGKMSAFSFSFNF